MDHQNGEPPRQNAIAGGSRVVARARPGAILAREPRGRENTMKRSLHGLIADGVVGGVLAGFVLMGYLHRAARDQHPFGLSALRGHPLLTQGVITGLVGAGVVALWFFALDVAAGHPLRTPAALGAALLFGASNVAAIYITFGLVAAYSVVHVAAFVMAGALFVAIAEQIERTPALILIALMGMIVLDAVVGATLALGAQWVLGTLGVWSVLVANVLAVCAMGWYVWATHPVLRRRLHEEVQVHV